MIALDDVVLRDDLDPRLGERDDDLIAQYADIFDALPPIEINQHNEVIDGWHRYLAAKQANRTEIAYVVVETDGDDDLADRMWESNLRHGVQYTRDQRQTHGLKLHERGLAAKVIATRVGVSASSVYSWTKELREKIKQERDAEIARLREEGMTQQEIADETGVPRGTIARNVQISKTGRTNKESGSETEPALEGVEEETGEESEAAEPEIAETNEAPAEEQSDEPEPEPEPPSVEPEMNEESAAEEESAALGPDTDEASADEELATPETELEPPPPEPIPDDILNTARAVMGAFAETRPDDYVARLVASPSEWMTITDDSLSHEVERELLTSAAAMCLWQEWMIWYQGERTGAFTDALGKIGDVFVRGQSGQWSLVAIATSKLRDIMRRFL